MPCQEHIEAVQRMQDTITKHLEEPITMRELADSAGYSPWHSARIFRELTGKTPFDYIRCLRLSRAALRLQERGRVLDVAFDFVFGSHEGFTRAFTKEFGVTPKNYQTHPHPFPLFVPDSVRERYHQMKGAIWMAEKKQKPASVFVQVIDRPARKLLLKRGKKATHYFEYCEEEGCDIWETLSAVKEALYEPIGAWLPPAMITKGTSVYVQGVELPTDFSGTIPAGYDLIDLPPCKMMIFQGQPFEDEHFEEAITDLWEVMKEYDPKLYGFEWADDDGPRFQLAPMGYRGYIEARPVRPAVR